MPLLHETALFELRAKFFTINNADIVTIRIQGRNWIGVPNLGSKSKFKLKAGKIGGVEPFIRFLQVLY